MNQAKVGNVKSIKPFYASRKKSYSKDQGVKASLLSSLYNQVNLEVLVEFLECQDLENCACRTNNFIPSYGDRSYSDMVNEPKFSKGSFELRDRNY